MIGIDLYSLDLLHEVIIENISSLQHSPIILIKVIMQLSEFVNGCKSKTVSVVIRVK
jgi:hypothetical protein